MAAATPSTAAWAETLRASAACPAQRAESGAVRVDRPDTTCRTPDQPLSRVPFRRARLDGEDGVVALRIDKMRPEATVARLRATLDGLGPDDKITARYTTALGVMHADAGDPGGACQSARMLRPVGGRRQARSRGMLIRRTPTSRRHASELSSGRECGRHRRGRGPPTDTCLPPWRRRRTWRSRRSGDGWWTDSPALPSSGG